MSCHSAGSKLSRLHSSGPGLWLFSAYVGHPNPSKILVFDGFWDLETSKNPVIWKDPPVVFSVLEGQKLHSPQVWQLIGRFWSGDFQEKLVLTGVLLGGFLYLRRWNWIFREL